jgi:hypothetical protein
VFRWRELTLNVVTRFYRRDSLWELWDDDGRLITRTRIPRAYHPWAMVDGDHVLASYRTGDTDEHVLVLLALARAPTVRP